MTDKQIMELVHKILDKGHDVELRKRKDGTITVIETKKNIVTA